MNITITQDNSVVEQLGSMGAQLIQLLKTLASGENTINLTGNIYTPYAYDRDIDYLCSYFSLQEDENTPGTYRGDTFVMSVGTTYIGFEDSNVESILLNAGIGSDGHVTKSQAANAVFTNQTFKNNTTITSFPEFKYFTKANNNPPSDLFYGCSNLANIDFSQITALADQEFRSTAITTANMPNLQSCTGSSQFRQCTGLTSLNLGGLSSIPNFMVRGCTSLQTVNASNATNVGNEAFASCSSLETFIFNPNVISIGASCFDTCSNLTIDTDDLSNLTNIGYTAFSRVKFKNGILNLPSLTTLGYGAFRRCPNIKKVLCLGKATETQQILGMWNEDNAQLQEAYLPYEVTELKENAFAYCKNLTTLKQYTQSVDNWVEGQTPTYTNIGNRIKSFGDYCFKGCTLLPLTQSDIPINSTSIGSDAFNGCSQLSGNWKFTNLTQLGEAAFYGTGISSCDFRGCTFTVAPKNGFNNCPNFKKVIFPTTVTTLRERWYPQQNYNTPIFVAGIENVTGYGDNYNWELNNVQIVNPICIKSKSFSENNKLICPYGQSSNTGNYTNSYFLPGCVKTYAANGGLIYSTPNNTAFTSYAQHNSSRACRFGLLYYKDIEHFNAFTFYGTVIENLVINNVTPPDLVNESSSDISTYQYYQDWTTKIFPTGIPMAPQITTLWVPDSAVATYQANPLYSGLTIKGINTKTNGTDYDLPRFATFADWEQAYDTAVANGNPAPIGLIEEYM